MYLERLEQFQTSWEQTSTHLYPFARRKLSGCLHPPLPTCCHRGWRRRCALALGLARCTPVRPRGFATGAAAAGSWDAQAALDCIVEAHAAGKVYT